MATLIQIPEKLSLSSNIPDVIISSTKEVHFTLYVGNENYGSKLLLDELLTPDADGRITVSIADVITSELSFTMPDGEDTVVQKEIMKDFAIWLDNEFAYTFTALRCGVERLSDTVSNFLRANFLTWQPQSKEVTYNQPEWITFCDPLGDRCLLKARFYHTDGTTSSCIIASCSEKAVMTVNVQFLRIWALGSGDRYGYFDIWVELASSSVLTYTQRYILTRQRPLDRFFLCENSLGGLDTFRFSGEVSFVPEIKYSQICKQGKLSADLPETDRIWTQNTGMLNGTEQQWVWELFRAQQVYTLRNGEIIPIVIKASSVQTSVKDNLCNLSFDYSLSEDKGLTTVVRSGQLPENIEIPGPDDTLFFLKPRLADYPDAALSGSLLLLLQSPFEEKWYKTSLEGLKKFLGEGLEQKNRWDEWQE